MDRGRHQWKVDEKSISEGCITESMVPGIYTIGVRGGFGSDAFEIANSVAFRITLKARTIEASKMDVS